MRPLTSNEKLALALIAFCLLAVVVSWPRGEPKWNGKTLTEWLNKLQAADAAFRVAPAEQNPKMFATRMQERAEAASAIYMIGPAAVPHLVAKLQTHDSPMRAHLAGWSKWAGWSAHPFSSDESRRKLALLGLTALESQAELALPALSAEFFRSDENDAVLRALTSIGKPAVPVLRAGLTNANVSVRRNALTGLTWFNTNANAAQADLRLLFTDPDATVRGLALYACSITAMTNENVLPLLLPSCHDSDREVRRWVASALGMAAVRLGGDSEGVQQAATAIAGLMADTDAETRSRAIGAMRQAKSAAEPHIPALMELLKDGSHSTRLNAFGTLARLKLRLPEVIPALAELLHDKEQYIREEVAARFREMPDEVERVQPGLMATLGDLGKARFEFRQMLKRQNEQQQAKRAELREAKQAERLKAKPEAKK